MGAWGGQKGDVAGIEGLLNCLSLVEAYVNVTTVFGPRAASISMLGRAAVRAHVFESARGPGTFNLLKVIAGAELVFRSDRQGRAAGSCGACSFIRTKRAG